VVTTKIDPFTTTIYQTDSLPEETFQQVKAVFSENYREANLAYLEKNIGKLRFLSAAYDADGTMAGFALGEARQIKLPRLGLENVNLAGLCCVGESYRRHGLFKLLAGLALGAYVLPPAERYLSCGRCAHPASFRGFIRNLSGVPRLRQTPTEWQQEVGIAVAEAYGSPGFDPETFVVSGSGVPIGWPVIEIEATEDEWAMFEHVDRSKGDSLLGISWNGAAPEGWIP